MTFSRQKPLGYTDDLDVISAAEADGLDTNQSLAVDGAAGGSYAPSAAITIGGAGLTMDAPFVLNVGALLQLAVGVTIANVDNQTLGPTAGIVRNMAIPTGNHVHAMVAAGNAGSLLMIAINDTAGTNSVQINRSGFVGGPPYIVLFPAGIAWKCALLYDDGTNWRLLGHYGCTAGSQA